MKASHQTRIFTILLTLLMLCGLTVAAMIGTEGADATEIYLGTVALGNGDYLANGETQVSGELPQDCTGYAHYEDGVLTLENYVLESAGKTHDATERAVLYAEGDVELVLTGASSLTNTADSMFYSQNGIVVKGNLTVGGSGSLTVDAVYPVNLRSNGDLTVNGGTLNLSDHLFAIIVEGEGSVTFNGGTVNASATNQTILVGDGSIAFNGGTVTASSTGTATFSKAIVAENFSYWDITVSTNSDGSSPVEYDADAIASYKYFHLEKYEYMVVYAPAGEGVSGSSEIDYAYAGDELVLGACPFIPAEGTRFKAWEIGNGSGVYKQPGETVKITAETYIYPIWEEIPTYTVVYVVAGEGVSGSNEIDYALDGEELTLLDCTFIPAEGTRFKAWEIGNGSGIYKQPGETVTITAETYIYPIWEEIPEYAYSYNPTDGTGSSTGDVVLDGTEITLETPDELSFSPPLGMVFDKWEIGHDTGVFKLPGETITITGETYIYAIWKPDPTCGVWIGGTEITTSNKSDVFGDGKVSYDPETQTLTLSGYSYSGAGYVFAAGREACVYANHALKLSLTGANALTYTGEANGFGIYVSEGALTVSGTGSLSVNANVAGIYTQDETNGLTVSGGSLILTVTDGETGMGICTNAFLQTDGSISIDSAMLGIYLPLDGATAILSGGELTVACETSGIFVAFNGETFVPVTPNLGSYPSYRASASVNADGSDAVPYRAEDLATYKYFKLIKAYTVSFDANGGEGSIAPVTGVLGEYDLPACTLTPPADKRFKAWSVSGVEYDAGETVSVSADVVVIAVWETIPSYTVEVTNGSADCVDSAKVGATVTLTASLAPADSYFSGWTVLSGDAVLADASAITTTFVMPEGAVSVKANYTKKQVIDELHFTIPTPVVGEKTNTAPVCLSPEKCTITEVEWYGYKNGSDQTLTAEDVFVLGKGFSVYFEVAENDTYMITEDTKFYLNGELTYQHNHVRRRVHTFYIPVSVSVVGGKAYTDDTYTAERTEAYRYDTLYLKADEAPAGKVFLMWKVTGYDYVSWNIHNEEMSIYLNSELNENITIEAIFATPIEEINVTLPKPVVGGTPNYTATDDSELCAVELRDWMANHDTLLPTDVFALDTTYVADLLFIPVDGYCVTSETVIKVNGKRIYGVSNILGSANASAQAYVEDLQRSTLTVEGAKLMVDGVITDETKFLIGTQITLIPDESCYPAGKEFAYWNFYTNSAAISYETLKDYACVITIVDSGRNIEGGAYYITPTYLSWVGANVPAPRPGQTPSFDTDMDSYNFTAEVLGWFEGAEAIGNDHVFEIGKTYTVRIRFDTLPGYYVNEEMTKSVWNAFLQGYSGLKGSIVEFDVNERYVIADFSYQSLYAFTNIEANLTNLKSGLLATTLGVTAPNDAHYTVEIYEIEIMASADPLYFHPLPIYALWQAGGTYRISVAFTAEEGYEFLSSSEMTISINGDTQVSYRGAGANMVLYSVTLTVDPSGESYRIDVENGTASVDEESVTEAGGGVTVTLTADPAPEWMEFYSWEIVSGENVAFTPTEPNTTFVMPAGNVSIKATYRYTHQTVTVTNGEANVERASSGETVTVTANEIPEGKIFAGWICTAGNVTFADEDALTTTFVMTEEAVAVKALFLEVIKTVNITVTAPSIGSTPDFTPVSAEPSKYTVELDQWYLLGDGYPSLTPSDVFAAGKGYSIRFTVIPTEDYTFDGETVFLLNGKTTVCYGSREDRELSFYMPYTLTVTDGKAQVDGVDCSAAALNSTVTITANTAPEGYIFDKWIAVSGNVSFTRADDQSTTFVMPAEAVEIRATYKKLHTHTYDEYSSNATHHWQECTDGVNCPDLAGSRRNEGTHTGGTATCSAKAVCSICGTAYGSLGDHDYGDLIEQVDPTHTSTVLAAGMKAHYYCDGCDTYFTEGKVATTENELKIDAPTHSFTVELGYKGVDGHANACACGAHVTPVTAHTPDRGAATENDPVKCTVCGYIITPATGHTSHTPDSEWSSDETHHWHDCTGCDGQQLNKDTHDWESACDSVCDICGKTRMVTHDYGDLIEQKDATCVEAGMAAHYECSVCHKLFDAEKDEKTAQQLAIEINDSHDFGAWASNGDGTHSRVCSRNNAHKETHDCMGGTATCTAKAVCSTCNTAYGDPAAHLDTDSNGKCDGCDRPMEAESETTDNTDESTETTDDTDETTNDTDETTGETDVTEGEQKGLSGGAIAGIVVGSVAVAGIGGFSLWWFVISKKSLVQLGEGCKAVAQSIKSLFVKK